MLCLNRENNQVIIIQDKETGKELRLVLLSSRNNYARLGFEDPDHNYTILRKEVQQRHQGADIPNPYYKDKIPKDRLERVKELNAKYPRISPETTTT